MLKTCGLLLKSRSQTQRLRRFKHRPGMQPWVTPLTVERDVNWGDMDSFLHVNNTVYFKWMETGRVAYAELLGMNVKADDSVSIILAETKCKFLLPVKYPDKVKIRSRTKQTGTSSWVLEHEIMSLSTSKVAAIGESVVVFYDYSKGSKTPIPPEIRAKISKIEDLELDM